MKKFLILLDKELFKKREEISNFVNLELVDIAPSDITISSVYKEVFSLRINNLTLSDIETVSGRKIKSTTKEVKEFLEKNGIESKPVLFYDIASRQYIASENFLSPGASKFAETRVREDVTVFLLKENSVESFLEILNRYMESKQEPKKIFVKEQKAKIAKNK